MEKFNKREKIAINVVYADWVFAFLLTLEYFWGKIPWITNIFYGFGYFFYTILLIGIMVATWSYYKMVFTHDWDERINPGNNVDEVEKNNLVLKKMPKFMKTIFKIFGYISTACVIVFSFLTGHWYFFTIAVLTFLFGKIAKIPWFANVIQVKLAKNLLLNDAEVEE